MRSGLLFLLAACGSSVYYYPAGDLSGSDFATFDGNSFDLATPDSLADLAVPDLAERDMSASVDMAMAMEFPDLLGIDFAPCGQPNGECCATGTDCDQTAAMSFGFIGAICSSRTCIACGKPAQPCCAMDKCVRSAQLNANCVTDVILGKICTECGGGGEPACTP